MNNFSNLRQTLMQPSKKTLIVGGIILAIIASLIAILFLVPRNQPHKTVDSVAVEYPAAWVEEKTDDDEKKAGIIFKLLHKKQKSAGLTVRTVNATRTYNAQELNYEMGEVVKSLEGDLKNFKLIDKKIEAVGQYQAIHIDYLENKDTKIAAAAKMIIIPTRHQFFYFTYRAKEHVLPTLKADINTLNTTLADYISQQLK